MSLTLMRTLKVMGNPPIAFALVVSSPADSRSEVAFGPDLVALLVGGHSHLTQSRLEVWCGAS